YGANFLLRKRMTEHVGIFDPNLGVSGNQIERGEETDYFLRGISQGFKGTYLPELKVHHRCDPTRLRVPYLVSYGMAKGHALRDQVMPVRNLVFVAMDQFFRAIWQICKGNKGNYYQCVVNFGIALGRYRHARQG
ncbi:MAG: hypothetical protein AAF197_08395, partial [Pseudomonadota bacterium]